MTWVTRYVAALLVLGIGDALWLMLYFAPKVFRPTLGPILREDMQWTAAIAFYLIYAVGIIVMAVAPALRSGAGWSTALVYGAMFGFFAYMTYDLTNYATLKAWTVQLAVQDVAWGTFISAIAAAAAYMVAKPAA